MIRFTLCAVSFAALVGFVSAQPKKSNTTNLTGTFKSFKDGMLEIRVTPIKKGDVAKDASFKVPNYVKCYIFVNQKLTPGVAKDVLGQAKVGTLIQLTAIGGTLKTVIVGKKSEM